METLPIFLKLADRPCLVVGGGASAAAKVDILLRAGARVIVASDSLSPELETWRAAGRFQQVPAGEAEALVPGRAIAFLADISEDAAAPIVAAAERAGVLVNVVDRPSLSTAVMGAIIDRSPVMVAVSTGGGAPVLAREVRHAIERVLPSRLGRLARFAARFRGAVKSAFPEISARRAFWEEFFASPVAASVLAGDEGRAGQAMLSLVNRDVRANRGAAAPGMVHLVGAGPGDPDLLTVKANQLLGRADVVVYDRLVAPAVLDRIRRDAERIPVGKAKGRHSMSQDEINALLVALARQGRQIVRLKGGDPFIFGRGGEELAYLRAHGVPVEVVPGVSAALGCAAAAQIPLTHRDIASTLTLVSGHGGAGEPDLDWAALAAARGTIAIYMGASVAGTISRELIGHGMSPDTPAAVIENGTREDERVVLGSLGGLSALVDRHGVAGPALIVLGDVTRLCRVTGAGEPASLARAVNA